MPKVSSIKTFNIQSKQNGTCSLDDIIKENIKNSKPLSKIDLSKTNVIYYMIILYFMMVDIAMILMKLIS